PPFVDELEAAGMVVLPMRGTNQLQSALALEFVRLFAPGTIGILFDNDQPSRTGEPSPEQQTINRFTESARAAGQTVEPVGLSRPDIICYLNPQAISGVCHANLPRWDSVIAEFRTASRTNFKVWLKDTHRIDMTSVRKIQEVLDTMRDQSLAFEGELVRAISGFTANILNGADADTAAG
ncbi:MAG: hypothetical protein VB036_00220, partial [Propionicimonas sp.]|nr:hypothetical protein [Propionicimonas sp.]